MTQDEENVPCALEKKVYSSAFGWNVLKILGLFALIFPFRLVSLLTFCSVDLSTGIGVVSTCLLLLCYGQFPLLCQLVFTLCIEVFLCWVHK